MPLEITRGTSREPVRPLILMLAIIAVTLTITRVRAQVSPIQFETDLPGLGLLHQRFMIALPIINDSTLTATNVQVTGVTLPPARLISPATLPASLGTLEPQQRTVFQADFDAASLVHNTQYLLTVIGTYQLNGVTFGFTLTRSISLPPAAPGSAATREGTATSESLSGAPFPPGPFAPEPNENEPGPPVPTGPFVPGTPTRSTSLQLSPVSASAVPAGDPPVTISANYAFGNLRSAGPGGAVGDPAEPSGGVSEGGVAFISFNWGAAYSAGGGTFSILNPLTMFPQPPQAPYGFCCDQKVHYVPQIETFVWIQQLTENGGGTPGAYRLAAASLADIQKYGGQTPAWKSWLITPEDLGLKHASQFDRPFLSLGTNYLYIGWDVACPTAPAVSGCISGREAIRVPLSQIQLGGSVIHFRYLTNPSFDAAAWGNDFTQDTGDEVFWEGQNGTSSLNVFSWAEGSDTIYISRELGLTSWTVNWAGQLSNSGAIIPSSPGQPHVPSPAPSPILSGETTPPTADWLFRSSAQWVTGTRSGDKVWFAWNAAPSGNLPQPYVEMVEIDTTGSFSKVKQVEIWNPAFAFGLPSLATNACNGEIGLSLAYGGGGTNYPNHAVGFWGDYLVYSTTTGSVTAAEYGDYLTLRQDYNPSLHGAFLDAFGYALQNVGPPGGTAIPPSQVKVNVHYVVFGRSGACGQ